MKEYLGTEEFNDIVVNVLPQIELEVEKLINYSNFPEIKEFVRAGRTKYRSLSAVFSYGVFRDDIQRAIPMAAALEISVSAGNIIDDIVENDRFRRGHEALHISNGEGYASLAASEALFLSLKHISDNYSKEIKNTTYEYFFDSILSSIKGEIVTKIKSVGNDDIGVEEYLDGLGKLNGSPYGFATALGAITAEASDSEIMSLYNHGFHKGMATQVLGEIKNVYGNDEHTRFSEIERGRNLLWIYAKDVLDELHVSYLENALENKDYKEFMKLLDDTNALKFCNKLIVKEADIALDYLSDLNITTYKNCLVKMMTDIVDEAETYID